MTYCKAKKRKGKAAKTIGTVLIILGIVCCLTLIFLDTFIRPTLEMLLDYKCRTAAERIISDAVFSRFSGDDDSGDLVTFIFDNDGRIAALNTDRSKINSLKALLNDAVNEGLSHVKEDTVSISLGTLSGISFLYGTGPELTFQIEPQGKADTRLVSTFDAAGINQTIHSIVLEVDAVLSPMMPGFSNTVDISYDILLTQTVIVGEVPETYSYIILDEENKSELANIDI